MNTEMPEQQSQLESQLDKTFGESLRKLSPHSWRGYGLSYEVDKANALDVFKSLKVDFDFDMLIDLTCVDWMEERDYRFEVVYQLMSLKNKTRLCIKIPVDEEDAEVDSVLELWNSANFMEREAWDMYGVSFKNHGDLRRILMYDEFEGHPLRKDYSILKKQPRIELRVPELHNTSKDMKREQLVSLPVRQRAAKGAK